MELHFTYYIKESPKTLKAQRQKKEKKAIKDNEKIYIPTMDELRAEENEVKPHLIFTITDENGDVIRKLTKGVSSGINRTTWDLRFPSTRPVRIKDGKYDPLSMGGSGTMVLPGKYFVSISQFVRGEITELVGPEPFEIVPLNNTTFPAENREELVAFQKKAAELYRVIGGTEEFAETLLERIRTDKQAAQQSANSNPELMAKIEKLEAQMDEIMWKFNGQQAKASQEENWPAPPSINERLGTIVWTHWRSTASITQTERDLFEILKEEFPPILEELKDIHDVKLPEIEKELDAMGAPYTPGRIPEWKFD